MTTNPDGYARPAGSWPAPVGRPGHGGHVRPYEGLAPIYDYVMRHVDYVHWANHVHSLLQRHGSSVRRIVELACGTGSVAYALARLGYEVAGFDACQAMVQVALDKGRGTDGPHFGVRDLRDLSGLGPFDAALCLYDSINYLLTLDDVDHALVAVNGVLAPGGIFIFDVCTERNSLRYFHDVRDTDQGPGFRYHRHSYYDAGERLQYNTFDIRLADGTRRQETHVQRIYPHHDLVACVEASPFELVAALDGFTQAPGSDRSERVHFVLRRCS